MTHDKWKMVILKNTWEELCREFTYGQYFELEYNLNKVEKIYKRYKENNYTEESIKLDMAKQLMLSFNTGFCVAAQNDAEREAFLRMCNGDYDE